MVAAVAADAAPARERLLDSAESRLLEHGPGGLVLEAVARDAGVSKGGLLYHFPNKDALVDGLVERMLEHFDRLQEDLAADDPEAAGRWTRAYLGSTITPQGEPADGSARLLAGILAAIGGDAARLAALRERFASWQGRLDHDGLDPSSATLVRLAADGLWLSQLLGLPSLPAARTHDVLTTLRRLTRP